MKKNLLTVALIITTFSVNHLFAQQFHLIKDINTATNGNPSIVPGVINSTPSFVELNGFVYFVADDGIHGQELWKSDGTASGTALVKDVNPGSASSNIVSLTLCNNKIFFEAYTTTGSTYNLWASDGTESGTIIVIPNDYVYNFSSYNGNLYTFDYYGHIWKSDGTVAGTSLFASISNGYPGTEIPVGINGVIYFTFYDYTNGEELYRTDGTVPGTYVVKSFTSPNNYNPSRLTSLNGKIYFITDTGTGSRLWVSDGTTAGTFLAFNSSNVLVDEGGAPFVISGNTLYFTGTTSATGDELFKYDDTAPGISLVSDIAPGSAGSLPSNLTSSNGVLYFSATDATGTTGLWKSDGTAAGTALIKNIDTDKSGVFSEILYANNGLFISYFDSTYGTELWKSDGTSVGTQLVKDIYPGPGSANPFFLTQLGSNILFSANDDVTGNELWKSDGTASGTELVKDINQITTSNSNPYSLTPFNNEIFFSATDSSNINTLWKSDGTKAGTLSYSYLSGLKILSPRSMTKLGNTLYYFTMVDTTINLWKTTLSGDVPVLLKSIPQRNFSIDYNFGVHAADNQLFFFISNGNTQVLQLWRTDGTAAGTVLLKNNFNYTTQGSPLAVVGNNIYIANETDTSASIWRSDGTIAGTVMLKSFQPTTFYEVDYLYSYNGNAYFNADDVSGYGLWKTDGTVPGTVFLKNLFRPGLSGHAVSNGKLFFDADDQVNGRQLWESDGTTNGTQMVKIITANGSSPQGFTDVNGTLFFTANTPDTGTELWKSDGTASGTVLVKDITPGTGSTSFVYSNPYSSNMINVNGEFYFVIYGSTFPFQYLYQSDGTPTGTHIVDTSGMPGVTTISFLTSLGSQLFFDGDSYQYSDELYGGGAGVLPVGLSKFTGQARGKENLLYWNTATEQNNSGFEIQRSSDGLNFSKIGFVNSHSVNGTSNFKLNYNFNDVGFTSLTNYYRLKQIDKDNNFSYSNIVVLKDVTPLSVGIIEIYPNPVKDILNVKIGSASNKNSTILLTDVSGKTILSRPSLVSNGETIIQLDVSHLSAGTYFIKLMAVDGSEKVIKKFVKQ